MSSRTLLRFFRFCFLLIFFSCKEPIFFLSYDANLFDEGVTLITDLPTKKSYMANVNIKVANLAKLSNGFSSISWNTMADGSGTSYKGGDTVVLSADLTLYAIWDLSGLQYSAKCYFEAIDSNVYLHSSEVGLSGDYADKLYTSEFGKKSNVVAPPSPVGFDKPGINQKEITNHGMVVEIRYPRKRITINFNSITGAGTSSFKNGVTGKYGAPTNLVPKHPSNFTFVKWVDNSGNQITLPSTFPSENLTIDSANALYVNGAGHPVYPAYLTINRDSFSTSSNDDVGQQTPSWATKPYSFQLVKRPITDPVYSDVFKFGNGSSQTPVRGSVTVTTGDQHGGQQGASSNDKKGGSFRIPALNRLVLPNGTVRIFAAMDIRYRGREDGNGDCGTTDFGGSDILIMYSDNGGASWTKKLIDVDNSFNESGKTTPISRSTDLGDPQLWTVGNNIYMGCVGGAAITTGRYNGEGATTRVFCSRDFGETWVESTNISQNRYTYAYMWNTIDLGLTNPGNQEGYSNLPCPGHGIVLTKDVPGTPMKAGMSAVPMQGGKNDFYCYVIYGNGDPSTWDRHGTQYIAPSHNNGEWQICQLDDGTILGIGKVSSSMARYNDNKWNIIGSDPWRGRGMSEVSILKLVNGDDNKYGVVAFGSPKGGGANSSTDFADVGRNEITVSFARDISKSVLTLTDSPLDSQRYYIQLRKKGQRYFGYTDMVMLDNETMGVIYECFDYDNDKIDGMRFMLIDVSLIIDRLSQK